MPKTCSKCGKKPVIHREYEGRHLCEEHFKRSIDKRVKKTIREGNLVESGDMIAVGLSGGKDSTVLLKQLVDIFGERPDIDLVALAVDEGISGYRESSLEAAQDLCEELGVKLEINSFQERYGKTMDEIVRSAERSNCTYCGILRRELLNAMARELGADKLAIGHNLDDEAQVLMMNHLRGDITRLARTGSRTDAAEHEKFVPRIKPLLHCPEREIALYSKLEGIGIIDTCPHVQQNSLRPRVKKFLNELEEDMNGVKHSIVSEGEELSRLVNEEYEFEGSDIEECRRCEEPCSEGLCRKCELLEELEE